MPAPRLRRVDTPLLGWGVPILVDPQNFMTPVADGFIACMGVTTPCLSLCFSVSLHLKETWETQNHQTFCVSLVLVSFTLIYRAACPFLVKHSTIITSEESLRDSKLPVTGCLRTKGQESVYETCACVIHTILLN